MKKLEFIATTDVEVGDIVTIPDIDEGPILVYDILLVHSARTGLADWKYVLKLNGVTLTAYTKREDFRFKGK